MGAYDRDPWLVFRGHKRDSSLGGLRSEWQGSLRLSINLPETPGHYTVRSRAKPI
jgi:hypothetical protein